MVRRWAGHKSFAMTDYYFDLADEMLGAIDYRGDRTDVATAPGFGVGYRWWGGRPGKSPGIHRAGAHLVACAGTLAPPVPSPAATLLDMLGGRALGSLDGAFAAAWWDGERATLTLIRDPFGVRSLYYVEHRGVLYFASELKQLLAIPDLPVQLDAAAVHKYLTFSFVPGEDVPIRGVRRLLPGRVATRHGGRLDITPYFALTESIDPALEDRGLLEHRGLDRPVAVTCGELGAQALEAGHAGTLRRQEVVRPARGAEGGHRRRV